MINFSKISKFSLSRIALLVIPIFMLSACSAFICLTGLCPSEQEVAAKILWNPPSLDHQNCPDISGKYNADTSDPFYNELFNKFPSTDDQMSSIYVTTEETQNGAKFPNPRNIKDYVLIEKKNQYLVISRMGSDGDLYRRKTINLNSPMIGCSGEDFIIRRVNVAAGIEGSPYGQADAMEQRFRRLTDGGLQIVTHTRQWGYNIAFGLSGMNPDGSRNSTGAPREGKYTTIYQKSE